MSRRVFITVAEVSGDKHAAQLIHGLKQLDPTLIIEGLGGPEMAAAGATIHHETVGGAAMLLKGATRALEVIRLLKWTRRYFERTRPDVQICVDSPAMNFHFAKLAKRQKVPVLMYVAPQLWAWREGRMKKLRKWVDRVACILPFEEAYFRRHGVNATFVGHPLFDELPADRGGTRGEGFPAKPPVIGLLPGSRRSEAVNNFPHLLDVARQIRAAFPEAIFLVPTTGATHPIVAERMEKFAAGARANGSRTTPPADWITFAQGQFDEMVPRCDLCITVSGTATLHVAGFGVPMIVVYRGSALLWHGIGRWLIPARTFALVNLLADGARGHGNGANAARDMSRDDHLVPEFIPWYGSNEPLANLAIEMLRHPERLARQREGLQSLVRSLDHPGASLKVARLALELMEKQSDGIVTPSTR